MALTLLSKESWELVQMKSRKYFKIEKNDAKVLISVTDMIKNVKKKGREQYLPDSCL